MWSRSSRGSDKVADLGFDFCVVFVRAMVDCGGSYKNLWILKGPESQMKGDETDRYFDSTQLPSTQVIKIFQATSRSTPVKALRARHHLLRLAYDSRNHTSATSWLPP